MSVEAVPDFSVRSVLIVGTHSDWKMISIFYNGDTSFKMELYTAENESEVRRHRAIKIVTGEAQPLYSNFGVAFASLEGLPIIYNCAGFV